MQVESSPIPLLTEDRASSLPGQFCPFHPRSTLELVEKAQGFCYVYCPEKMCFMFSASSEWKEGIEWIAHHTHADVNPKDLRKSVEYWRWKRMSETKGAFYSTKIPVWNFGNSTCPMVHSDCTDPTQATKRVVIVLVSRIQKSGTGNNNFVKWKGTFRSDRPKWPDRSLWTTFKVGP